MKKLLYLILLVLLLVLIFFAFKSCNSEKDNGGKLEGERAVEVSEDLTEAVEKENIGSPRGFRSVFILASIEFTCFLKENPELIDNPSEAELVLHKIYQKHGLPAEDNSAMLKILDEYGDDSSVLREIQLGNCL